MNTTVWVASGLLTAAFLMAGVLKSTQPVTKLREQMGWVDDISVGTLASFSRS